MLVRFVFNPLSRAPANDNAEPFTPRSVRELLCDGCGRVEASRFGLCEDCIADAEALAAERRNFHPDAEH